MNRPLLSICIPTFNRAWVLERSLTFHLQQFDALGVDFEIVVADDGSTDSTSELLQRYADEPRVKYFRRVKNSGFVDNYSFVLRQSIGEFAVFLGDDDLLIPEKVIEYINVMQADSTIGMFQAPWMLVDERPGGGPLTAFYNVPGRTRIAKNNYAGLLELLFGYHIFPEFYIIRRDVLEVCISKCPSFIFWPFLYVGRALKHCDIMFDPEPFANVTAMSNNPQLQQGTKESMYEWDRYKGGLEFLFSHVPLKPIESFEKRLAFMAKAQAFMSARQRIALGLLATKRHWTSAYVLLHRIKANIGPFMSEQEESTIRISAALMSCVEDAIGLTTGSVVIDPAIGDQPLSVLPKDLMDRVVAAGNPAQEPVVHVILTDGYRQTLPASATRVDLRHYLVQFGGT